MPFDQTPQRAHRVHVDPGRKVSKVFHMKIGSQEPIGTRVERKGAQIFAYIISRNERSKVRIIYSRFANHRIFPYTFPYQCMG